MADLIDLEASIILVLDLIISEGFTIHSSTGLLSEMVFMVGLTMAFMVMVSFLTVHFLTIAFMRIVFTTQDALTHQEILDTIIDLTTEVTPQDAR